MKTEIIVDIADLSLDEGRHDTQQKEMEVHRYNQSLSYLGLFQNAS